VSYDEVAEATDVPVGTVRSRLARGRAILRKELESFAIEQGYLKKATTE
jgi:RNA polymerase sigma-70 factor (ECF subfamily)